MESKILKFSRNLFGIKQKLGCIFFGLIQQLLFCFSTLSIFFSRLSALYLSLQDNGWKSPHLRSQPPKLKLITTNFHFQEPVQTKRCDSPPKDVPGSVLAKTAYGTFLAQRVKRQQEKQTNTSINRLRFPWKKEFTRYQLIWNSAEMVAHAGLAAGGKLELGDELSNN